MKGFLKVDHVVRNCAARLPGSSGWALLEIISRSTLKNSGVRTPDIMAALGVGERTAERALEDLALLGFTVCTDDVTSLTQDWYKRCDNFGTTLVPKLSAKVLKNTVQHVQNESCNEVEVRERSRSKEVKPKDLKTIQESKIPGFLEDQKMDSFSSENPELNLAEPPDAKPVWKREPKPPTEWQAMFGAVALACFGVNTGLAGKPLSLVSNTAKSLIAMKFSPNEIPKILDWIRKNETWRGTINPSDLESAGPKWKAGMIQPRNGFQGKRISAARMDFEDPDYWAEDAAAMDAAIAEAVANDPNRTLEVSS